jgi:hypothetical protein
MWQRGFVFNPATIWANGRRFCYRSCEIVDNAGRTGG